MRPSRILKLYHCELDKNIRQRFTLISLPLLALIAAVLTRTADRILPSENLTGYLVLIHVVTMAVGSIIPLLAIIFGSMLVAGETAGGTFRMVLTRPVTRAEFLTAKVLMGATYAAGILAFYVLIVVAVALGTFTFGPVVEDGEVLVTHAQIVQHTAFAMLLLLLPLLAAVSFGILMSVLSRSLSTAIGAAVGLQIGLDVIKHMLHIGDFRLAPYVFSTHFDAFLRIAEDFALGHNPIWFDPEPTPAAILTPLVSVAVFLTIAYAVFLRRDLNQ